MSDSSPAGSRGGAQILITGTGSLAEAVLYTIAGHSAVSDGEPLRVYIAGRNAERIRWLLRAANARALALASGTRFTAEPLDWDSLDSLAELIGRTAPVVILHAASLQSPWALGKADAWSRLVARAGFGITVSLQADLLLRLANAVQSTGSSSLVVNACYPDAVNVVMARLGLPIAIGIGNVAILAAVVASEWAEDRPGAVKVLANHWHLAQCLKPAGERAGAPRIWLDGLEVDDTATGLAGLQLPSDAALNWITGATAVPLLMAMLGRGKRYAGHAPGPGGLPGGYPVTVEGRHIDLDLPTGISLNDAVSWNRSTQILDGFDMDEQGFVRYGESGAAAVAEYSPALAAGFSVADIGSVAREMVALRRSLTEQ